MDSGHDKKRMNAEGDRLSNLPDDLIHKILSYIGIKQAIETSGLSSRWRYIWTSMPYLNLSTKDFRRLPKFSKFVKRLLSSRNNQSEVFSVNFTFRGKVSQEFVKSILNYAFAHNVQQLNITGLPGHVYPLAEFPSSLFSSKSLKHLTFSGRIEEHSVMAIPTWMLPNLTTLNLHGVTFFDNKCADLFSTCANLKNLTLKSCISLNSFIICHSGLSSLTLECGSNRVNVVAPQLKNLTIKRWRGIHLVSTPNLSSLRFTDEFISYYKDNDAGILQLPADLLHLEKVDICIYSVYENKAYTRKIVSLLQQLHCVKFLTLNLEIVKFFSSVLLISNQTSPFVNLKSLKIYPVYVAPEEQTREKLTIPTEAKNYLLGSSPCATFTMVPHEEIRVVKNVTSARNLMRELQDKLKVYIETNMTDIEQDKAPMESHMAKLREQVAYVDRTVSMFLRIDALLAKLPLSHWYKLQARLSGLRAEVTTILNHVMDQLNQCD